MNRAAVVHQQEPRIATSPVRGEGIPAFLSFYQYLLFNGLGLSFKGKYRRNDDIKREDPLIYHSSQQVTQGDARCVWGLGDASCVRSNTRTTLPASFWEHPFPFGSEPDRSPSTKTAWRRRHSSE
ncbi:hypothetical protein CEXT_780941 [Caerostris extrusa]|uniref:Uncharacterized protein n=1 Tax=Caerostris extrusa TaxID=172846 RepID=A0AAV4YES5_CAEEX|nr:hypothetical protein CEXT_780941 [Caerostris extrusa]